ncbi:MAG: TonB-dependent receptor plug domain-containing protein [Puniceicoccaceae bacterium]
MKLHKYILPLLVPLTPVFAQTEEGTAEEEVFELSPFVVDAGEDTGYYASQTLAGTRLKTNVQDVGSSIQILTEDFLDDVGADDVNDLFLYTTNTEAAGLNGNFTDYTTGETSLGDEAFRIDPQGAQRVRGLSRADLTRNYFLTRLPSDRYNTERVEINRGANSILFGLGSPAGIANTSLKQARYSDFGEIRYRLDGEGTHRGELDYNTEVIDGKLAVRFGVLVDRTKYRQEPAFEDDDRFYVNLNARPWKGAAVRAWAETGKRKANRPSLIFPASTIKFWFDASPEVNGQIQDILDENGVLNISGNPLTVPSTNRIAYDPDLYDKWARNINNIINADDVNLDGVVDGADDTARIMALQNAIVFPQNNADRYVKHPNASRQLLKVFNYNQAVAGGAPYGVDTIQSNLNSAQWRPKLKGGVPPETDLSGNGRFSYNYNSSIQPWRDRDPVLVPESIDDLAIYDFTENLLSGDSAFQNDDFDQYNIAFEQLLFEEKFGIEIAYDKQSYERETFVPFQGFTGVFVDTMPSYLGAPNPNYGRAFVQARTNKIDITDDRDSFRATAFFRFNPAEIWEDSRIAAWLGEHTFTGLYNDYSQSFTRSAFNQYYTDQYAGSTLRDNDTQIADSNRRFNYIVYIGDQNLYDVGTYDEVRLHRMTDQQLWNPGQTATFTDIDPVTGELMETTITSEVFMDNYTLETLDNESYAAIWNGHFFNGNLIGLVGWRQDEVYAVNYDADIDPDTALAHPDRLLINGIDDRKVESLSWSVVAHVPDRWMPQGTGVTLHYGYSENFQLGTTGVDLYGNQVAPPAGETKEYGITASLFDGKLYARLNWYETSLLNRPLEGSANLYDTFIDRILLHTYANLKESQVAGPQDPVIDPDTGEPDPNSGTENFDLGMAALAGLEPLIPQSALEAANLVGIDGTGNVATNRRDLNWADTEDVTAEGFEVELTYNPTRSWRISLNVAQQETVTSNYSPRLAALLELTDPWLNSATGSIKDLRFFPNYDNDPIQWMTGPFVDTNEIGERSELLVYDEYRNAVAQQGKVSAEQREWRVNLITNYNFRDGRLKGFGIGGALRWQDGAVIGYPTELIDGQFISDIDNPHVAPSETTVDAWIRYRTKIFKGKVDWQIELRVQNLNTDADDLIPVVAKNSQEYEVAVWRSGPPRVFRLTNTFKF